MVRLAFAHGAAAGAQRAVGTGVLGGIITATLLAIFLVPLFFRLTARKEETGTTRKKHRARGWNGNAWNSPCRGRRGKTEPCMGPLPVPDALKKGARFRAPRLSGKRLKEVFLRREGLKSLVIRMGWNPVCRCARAPGYSLPRAFRKMNT